MTKREEVKEQAAYKARLLVETLHDEPRQRWTREMFELADAIEKAICDVALPLLDGDA